MNYVSISGVSLSLYKIVLRLKTRAIFAEKKLNQSTVMAVKGLVKVLKLKSYKWQLF